MRIDRSFSSCFPLVLAFLFIGSACSVVEDIDRIKISEWHPEVAVSLVNSSISLGEILDEFDTSEYLTTDSSGMLSVRYEDEVYRATTEGMLILQDIAFPMLDTAILVPVPSQHGERITRMNLFRGNLAYAFNSSHTGAVEVEIYFANASLNGQILTETITVNSPVNTSGSIDLIGYQLDYTDDLIELRYRATEVASGQVVALNGFIMRLENMSYNFVEGFLGQYDFALASDSLELDFFDLWDEGSIYFQEPSLQLHIENTAGVPIHLRAAVLDAVTDEGVISLLTPELGSGVSLAYPNLGEIGAGKTTTITLDHTNSDLPAALAASPRAFAFDFEAVAFPDNDPSKTGFITDQSAINVSMTASLPIYASLADISMRDTFEMELDDVGNLSSAGFKMITENGFPLDIDLQIYFLDAQYQIMDSLSSGVAMTLTAAPVGADGRATTVVEDIHEIEIDADRLEALQNASWISYRASLESPQGGSIPIRLYEGYQMGIKLGITAGL